MLWEVAVDIFPVEKSYKDDRIILQDQPNPVVCKLDPVIIITPCKLFDIYNLIQPLGLFYLLNDLFDLVFEYLTSDPL